MKDMLFKLKVRAFFLIACFMLPSLVLADIAVLIHGYHSSGNVWRYNGITRILAENGWHDAGFYAPNGNRLLLDDDGKHLITAELPSEAPIEIQAGLLSQYLQNISRQYPQQKLHLIGHSSGGLVARLSLVNDFAHPRSQDSAVQPDFYTKVVQLITIATPHLGSPIADMADKASDTPIGFFAPFFGADEINRSERLYKQLGQEDKNYFLFWLNRQPHPPMYYTSIIRANGSILKGDWLVPPRSQNMAYVPAIGASAKIILTPGSHNLKSADGFLLRNLLP
jgi:pimeloyl-ACP methyl ester carboxylesterase